MRLSHLLGETMLSDRLCERVFCAMVASRGRLIAAYSVALVDSVYFHYRVRSAIGCGCTPLEVGTRTFGFCTSGVAGEIGGGAGTCGTGRALVRDVLLMLGRALGTLGASSAVGARVGSVMVSDGVGERLCHCSKIWCTFSMACSWVS